MTNSTITKPFIAHNIQLTDNEQLALQDLLALVSNMMVTLRTQKKLEYNHEDYYKFVHLMTELSSLSRQLPHFGQPKCR